MRIKKRSKRRGRYLPLTGIQKIDSEFLNEMERVKTRLGFIKDEAIIKAFQEVLLSAYTAAIELRTSECEVDYEIKLAQIKAREKEETPWRRCWLWRLLFRPLTNRAQDIIEERAELNADVIHTAAEKEIEAERNKQPETIKTPSKRKLRREMRKELKMIIKRADNADLREAFEEPQDVPEPESTEPAPCAPEKPANTQEPTKTQDKQLPGQMTLDDVQTPAQPARRPRPPRNCRKPPT